MYFMMLLPIRKSFLGVLGLDCFARRTLVSHDHWDLGLHNPCDARQSSLHLTQVKMSTWLDRDGNVYNKFNAPKLLHDCMLSV